MRSILVWALLSLVLTGCATVTTNANDPLAVYHAVKPRSILVLPVVNQSLDIEASTSVLTTLPKLLGERGYYVFPVNTVKSLLEFEGFSDPHEIHDAPTAKLAALFHADAVLYVTIHQWTSRYIGISTTTEVDIEYVVKDAQGNAIFSDREQASYNSDPESSSDDFLGNLISSAISAAIERAAPKYLPLTREANNRAFLLSDPPLPPGPYHPHYADYYTRLQAQQAAQETPPAAQ